MYGIHLCRPALETSDYPEMFVSSDSRGFPDSADEIGHRIWILQVKIHKLK